MDNRWLLLPAVGGLIGYVTNVIAIRMLFRPRRPVAIPGTSWTIQGLIPRRQHDIAVAIGETVENDLLPIDALLDRLKMDERREEVVSMVMEHLETRVRGGLLKMLPAVLQEPIVSFLGTRAGQEVGELMDRITVDLEHRLRTDLHVGELVQQQVKDLDLGDLEGLVVQVAHRELRYIEVFGALIGVVIGLGQAALVALIP